MPSHEILSSELIGHLSTQAYNVIGVTGFVLYMVSYFLLQIGKVKGHGNAYTIMNLTAALLVLISLADSFNLASALIQIAWILISLIGLFRLNLSRRLYSGQR